MLGVKAKQFPGALVCFKEEATQTQPEGRFCCPRKAPEQTKHSVCGSSLFSTSDGQCSLELGFWCQTRKEAGGGEKPKAGEPSPHTAPRKKGRNEGRGCSLRASRPPCECGPARTPSASTTCGSWHHVLVGAPPVRDEVRGRSRDSTRGSSTFTSSNDVVRVLPSRKPWPSLLHWPSHVHRPPCPHWPGPLRTDLPAGTVTSLASLTQHLHYDPLNSLG